MTGARPLVADDFAFCGPFLQIADQQYHDLPEDLRAGVDRRITGSPDRRAGAQCLAPPTNGRQ